MCIGPFLASRSARTSLNSLRIRLSSLTGYSEVECGVTIMCSSMPALASFSRTLAAHSTYYASIRSRLLSYYGKGGSKARLSKSVSWSGRPRVPAHTNAVYSGGTANNDFEKEAKMKAVSVDQLSDEGSSQERIALERA